jgi:hypothetical protein
VPSPREEVIWVQEAAVTAEVTHAATMDVVEASAQEAAMAQKSIVALVKEAEDQTALAEMEARKRVSRMEAESSAALASACGEVEVFTRGIALLEGELTEAR